MESADKRISSWKNARDQFASIEHSCLPPQRVGPWRGMYLTQTLLSQSEPISPCLSSSLPPCQWGEKQKSSERHKSVHLFQACLRRVSHPQWVPGSKRAKISHCRIKKRTSGNFHISKREKIKHPRRRQVVLTTVVGLSVSGSPP